MTMSLDLITFLWRIYEMVSIMLSKDIVNIFRFSKCSLHGDREVKLLITRIVVFCSTNAFNNRVSPQLTQNIIIPWDKLDCKSP